MSNTNLTIPSPLLETPIDKLNLSRRSYNALARNGLSTVGEVIDLGYGGILRLHNVGDKAAKEIVESVEEFYNLTLNDDSRENILIEIGSKSQPLLKLDPEERPNLVQLIVPFTDIVLKIYNDPRGYQFIKHYYGLDGGDTYTLQDIGDAEGLSRERVRQVNERTMSRLAAVLFGLKELKEYSVPDNLVKEASELRSIFADRYAIWLEREIFEEIENRYKWKITSNKKNDLKFLLTIFGFKELIQRPPNYNGSKIRAWQIDISLDIKMVWQAMVAIYKVLMLDIVPLSYFELKMRINHKRKKKLEDEQIQYALKICPDFEITEEGKYQLKFEHLSSIGDQAYRVLAENQGPLHYREILREINHRLVVAGVPATANYRSMTGQMVTDRKFKPIGKSGKWKLAEWDHIHTQTTVEVMAEFLHLKKDSATVEEIHNYVIKKRPDVPKQSIITYLYEKDAFVRVSPSQFALAEWGIKAVPPRKRKSMSDRLLPEIKDVFLSRSNQAILLNELVLELEKRTGIRSSNIYSWIKRSSVIDTENDPEEGKRKIAKYNADNIQPGISFHRETLMQIVQKAIENYLAQQPGKRATVAELSIIVGKETNCKKHTFYNYLDRMENVKKERIANKLYCYLDEEPESLNNRLDFPQLANIDEVSLRGNIERAIKLLNVDSVDIGLFQLGKIFENELKRLLLTAQRKNVYNVSRNDMARLVNMIDCIVREGIIQKKHHLTFLRQERNERAHGEIPQRSEREELMRYAPFWGGLYIDYIVIFHQEWLKIENSHPS